MQLWHTIQVVFVFRDDTLVFTDFQASSIHITRVDMYETARIERYQRLQN